MATGFFLLLHLMLFDFIQATAAHYAQWQKTRGGNFIAAANLYAIAGEVTQALQLYEQQGDWREILNVVGFIRRINRKRNICAVQFIKGRR